MSMDDLKQRPLWFLWMYKAKGGKPTKVPFAADGCQTGTDKAHEDTWVPYAKAVDAQKKYPGSGIGLKIPEGFFLLDKDHVDMDDPFVKLLLSRFGSYAEISPSGNGLHILGRYDLTKLPIYYEESRRRFVLDGDFYQKNSKIGLELYLGDVTNCC